LHVSLQDNLDEISHLIAKEGTQVIDRALDLVHRQDIDNEMNKPAIVLALPTAGDKGAIATSSTAQEKKRQASSVAGKEDAGGSQKKPRSPSKGDRLLLL
jgi:hypothetical protein